MRAIQVSPSHPEEDKISLNSNRIVKSAKYGQRQQSKSLTTNNNISETMSFDSAKDRNSRGNGGEIRNFGEYSS